MRRLPKSGKPKNENPSIEDNLEDEDVSEDPSNNKNIVMYTSEKKFTEQSLNQFNTLKGTGPVISGMPGAAAVRRGS